MTKRNLVLLAVLLGTLLSAACGGQQEANAIAGNEDGKLVNAANAIMDETMADEDERCQYKAVTRRMGDDNKLGFLDEIRPGCVEAGMLSDWNDTWDKYADISWTEYSVAQ